MGYTWPQVIYLGFCMFMGCVIGSLIGQWLDARYKVSPRYK